MSSAAQFAANQANARLSTGPISENGKAISSHNNLRHGFRSQTVLLPGDDPAAYEALLADLTEYYAPQELIETRFVREMTDADWRLRRLREHLESAITRHMAKLASTYPDASAMELQSLAIEPSAKPELPTEPGCATKPNSNASTTALSKTGPVIRNCAATPSSKKPTSR
jgi:hypothetical protein